MNADRKNLLVNAGLFQALWLSAVYGSAKGWLWPCIVLVIILAMWQLQPVRRAKSDKKLVLIAIIMGLVIDSIWINLGIMEFTNKTPIGWISPIWILALWIGFALTINHSLSFLKIHPLLPILLGLISAPLSYYAGKRLGAVEYNYDALLVSAYIGLAWAIALPLLVRASKKRFL
ncbi:MAG: DUF2878 domain-containing protein [Acidiferrobacterales bacterium]|nr:DUF2878 domain-containing protein [Acidiferrobacterales bacterium]